MVVNKKFIVKLKNFGGKGCQNPVTLPLHTLLVALLNETQGIKII